LNVLEATPAHVDETLEDVGLIKIWEEFSCVIKKDIYHLKDIMMRGESIWV
jgi:hypothetical protein